MRKTLTLGTEVSIIPIHNNNKGDSMSYDQIDTVESMLQDVQCEAVNAQSQVNNTVSLLDDLEDAIDDLRAQLGDKSELKDRVMDAVRSNVENSLTALADTIVDGVELDLSDILD